MARKRKRKIESNDYFHFLAIVLFDLSEGKDYALSKQFLRDARIVIGEAGNNPKSHREAPNLKQQSEDDSWLTIGFDLEPTKVGQVPVHC